MMCLTAQPTKLYALTRVIIDFSERPKTARFSTRTKCMHVHARDKDFSTFSEIATMNANLYTKYMPGLNYHIAKTT